MRGSPAHAQEPEVESRTSRRALFSRGFLSMLPLWAGAIPSGIAYGLAGRGAGLSIGETQLMSVVVFSAAAQLSAASLLDDGVSSAILIGTAMALSAQLLLLGLVVGRQLRPARVERLVAAWFLTDGAYGVAAALGTLRLPTLLGAGMSMFLAWNAGTALGAVAGHALPDLRRLGVDLVAPLTFLAVLVPQLRTRPAAMAALAAGVATLLLTQVAPAGVAVLGAGVVGCAAGAWWTRHRRPEDGS